MLSRLWGRLFEEHLMDVSNSGLSSTIRQSIDRHTVAVQDVKREAKDSDIERRELEKSDEGYQEEHREQRQDDRHRVDILV
jgi:hypothetical protein